MVSPGMTRLRRLAAGTLRLREPLPSAWPRLDRREVLLALMVFALALAPRVTWGIYADRPPQGLNDPTVYDFLAHQIAEGHGYSRPTGEPFAYYPVAYPATMGGLYWLLDHTFLPDNYVRASKMMNAVFGALTVLMVYLLALRLFDRRVGLLAAGVLAFFPSQVFYTGTLLSEPLFTMLVVAGMLVLLWKPWRSDGVEAWRLAAFGLLMGAATLTRAITLLVPVVLALVWLFTLRPRWKALTQAGVVALGIAVFVVPWSVRNSVKLGEPILISTNAGDDLCIGNFAGAPGHFVLSGPCFEGFENLPPKELEVQRNREGLERAIRFAVDHPLEEARLVLKKAYYLLYKDDDGLFAAESYGHDFFIGEYLRGVLSFAANGWYFAVAAWAIVSSPLFLVAGDARRAMLYLIGVYLLLIPLAFFGDPRFHYPAVPIAALVASVGVAAAWSRRPRLAGGPAPEPAIIVAT